MLFPTVNKRKKWLLLLLVSIVFLNLYFHFSFKGVLEDRARWLDGIFIYTLTPIQKGIRDVEGLVHDGFAIGKRLWSVDRENARLRAELDQRNLELHRFNELKLENDRLRELLKFREEQKLELVPAKIIGRDVSLYFRTVRIDRGRDDGIDRSMAVVSPEGVVGRIISATAKTAVVLLITDVNSRVDAVVQRSRDQAIVGGSSTGALNLRFLPRRKDIRQGDVLVTSEIGQNFPAGFKIGVVIGMGEDPDLILNQAELEPVVNFDSLDEVLVVKRDD